MDKILIVRLSSLGDIVLTTPVVKAIREEFPRAEIYYLTTNTYQDLLNDNPYIDHVVCIESYHGVHWLSSLFKMARFFRREKIDLMVDMHFRHWSYAHAGLWLFLLYYLIGAKRRVKAYKPPLDRRNKRKAKLPHVLDWYQECLKKIGIDRKLVVPHLYVSPEASEWARCLLSKRAVPSDTIFIGIAPGASGPSKQWSKENFKKVCQHLIKNFQVKLLLFAKESERDLITYLGDGLPPESFIPIINFSLKQVTALLTRCELLISNDSGLMHMACALDVPVITIFGATHPRLGYFPLGENATVLYADISCSPCSRWGEKACRNKIKICFEVTRPDKVISVAENFLRAKGIGHEDAAIRSTF